MTIAFIMLSILSILSLFFGKLFFFNHKNRFIREKMTTLGVIIISLYSFFSVIIMFFSSVYAKPILVFCGLSPFIIGHFATYKRLNFYTILQLSVFIAGLIFALRSGLTE